MDQHVLSVSREADMADEARILVIDDNSSVREAFRKILDRDSAPGDASLDSLECAVLGIKPAPRQAGSLDFRVHLANDGEEGCLSAWRAFGAQRPFAVAFVDMRMPGGWDGLKTIEELWRLDPDIQVVICTAYADHSWDDINARLGRTDRLLILRKPFETIEVIQLASALFDKWCLQKRRQTRLDDLEERVAERTRALNETNAELTLEIATRREAEANLKESENRYRMLFEGNPLPMWLYDLDTVRFLAVNNMACEKYGYTRDEFLAMTLRDIRPPQDVPRVEESVRMTPPDIFNSGLWRHHAKDGRAIDVEIISHPINYDGRAARFVCPLDVTERLRAEAAVREAECRFRALVEQSITGIYVVGQGQLTYSNPKLCEILGYDLDELRALDITSLLVEEDRALARDVMRRRAEGQQDSIVFECRAQRKDGHVIHLCVESKVIRIGAAEVAMGVVRDISPRIHALEALHESESRFRQLAENINEVFFLEDSQNHRTLYVSPAYEQIWGKSCESLHADPSSWESSVHPEDRAQVQRSLEERKATGRFDHEYRIVRPDGAVRWIRAHGSPIRNAGGLVYRTASVAEDVTERRNAEEKVRQLAADLERRVAERTAALEAANLELEAFDYSISHDLRAPLRHITGFSAALMAECAAQLDDHGKEYVRRLHGAGEKMDRMVGDLLRMSTLTRGEACREDVDVSALAETVLADLRRTNPDRDVETIVVPGIKANADRGLLHIALENLLGNAWKFTGNRARARIEVGTVASARNEILFVRDNGAGFDMAYADKLFAPFRRLHKESEFKGTGIGLATVQRIVHRHGGRVWAEGAVGQGATLYLTLAS